MLLYKLYILRIHYKSQYLMSLVLMPAMALGLNLTEGLNFCDILDFSLTHILLLRIYPSMFFVKRLVYNG